MKYSLIALSILSLAASAIAGENRTPKREREVLKCVRSVVESNRNTEATLHTAAEVLDDFGTANGADMGRVLDKCEALKATVKAQPKRARVDVEIDLAKMLREKAFAKKVLDVLNGIRLPYMNCDLSSLHADVEFFVGLGAGISQGVCLSDTGRKFAVAIPSIDLAGGFGVSVSQELGSYRLRSNKFVFENGCVMSAKKMFGQDAVGPAIAECNTTTEQDQDTHGFVIGAATTVREGLLIKAIPLGNDFREMASKLKEESVQ